MKGSSIAWAAERLLVVCLLFIPLALRGQTAHLVWDAEPQASGGRDSLDPGPLYPLGERVLTLTGGRTGSRASMWVSDGTPNGTELLTDSEGVTAASFRVLGSARGLLFWAFDRGELWRSDGTRAGTFALSDAYDGPQISGQAAFLGGILYFAGCIPDADCALWKTDGTAAGTRRVKEFSPEENAGSPDDLTTVGNRIFFVTFNEISRPILWTTDGTDGGTHIVTTGLRSIRLPTAAGGKLFFLGRRPQTASQDEGEELWVSDGTEAGTRPLTAFENTAPFADTKWIKASASKVYLLANDVTHGFEVWASDGTATGTGRITEFGYYSPFATPGYPDDALQPDDLWEIGDRLVFTASDGVSGYKLWSTRGKPETTALLHPVCPNGCSSRPDIAPAGGRVVFTATDAAHGNEPWSTDGTPAGTALVKDICPGACFGAGYTLVPIANGAAFDGASAAGKHEIWTTDGTASGTRKLTTLPGPFELRDLTSAGGKSFAATGGLYSTRDLWVIDRGSVSRLGDNSALATASSGATGLLGAGGRIFFGTCDDGQRRLWSSAGTPAATAELTGFRPVNCSTGSRPEFLGSAGGLIFFRAPDSDFHPQLWRSDGTPGGTVQLTNVFGSDVSQAAELQGRLVFPVSAGDGSAFWGSDGTPAGTHELFQLPAGLYVQFFAVLGPDLYFLTNSLLLETDILWRSDGTQAGTRQLSAGVPQIDEGPREPQFTRLGSQILFRAGDWLWKTDGTAGGTGPIPPPRTFDESPEPYYLVAYQGAVYFWSGDGNFPSRTEFLWRTDGTTAGTLPVLEFTGNAGSQGGLVPVGSRLLFLAYNDQGRSQIWASNGTAAGTGPIDQVHEVVASALTAAGDRAYFADDDPVHGQELWVTDGTTAGTRMVQDLSPGSASSSPLELTVVGGQLFFTADDGLTGREVWALPLAGGTCQRSETTLCLGDGRFAVEAVWRDFQGHQGTGHAVPLTADTGYFWFFSPDNVEAILKVLDGRALNDHFWVFYGALSNVEYALTVRDTQTGLSRRYFNPAGQFASFGDTHGFGRLGAFSSTVQPPAATPLALVSERTEAAAATGSCQPTATRLCLNGGRFAVEARWKDFAGHTGTGTAVGLTGDTGYFWFFGPDNVEVVLKVLDGRPLNGKFWVFFGALSNVEYTLTVTDTETGAVRTYTNPSGRFASLGDTAAF